MNRTQFQVLVILLYAKRGQELVELGGGLIKVSTGFIARLSKLKQERIRPLLKSLHSLGYITSLTLAHGHAVLQLKEPARHFHGILRRDSHET